MNGGPVVSMTLARLKKNGKLDMIVMNDSINLLTENTMTRLTAFPGNGDGTFGAPRMYNAPEDGEVINGTKPILAAIDENVDKALDVVLLSHQLTVFLGDGFGSLRGAPITRSPDADGIVTGDFNGDGNPDVAVANVPECTGGQVCETTVSVFLGNGTNWFPAAKIFHSGIFGADVNSDMGIAAGDVNGDGKMDLVLKGGADFLSVLLGNGDGTFKSPNASDINEGSLDVHLADVNNDQKLDLVLDSGVLLGNGNGTFGALIPYPTYPAPGIIKVAVADLNGDGKLDLIAGIDTFTNNPDNPDAYGLAVLFGDGTGHFTKQSEWSTCCMVTQIVPERMNRDNVADFAVAFRPRHLRVRQQGGRHLSRNQSFVLPDKQPIYRGRRFYG